MWQVLTVFHEILQYFQIGFCHESLFWVRKRGLLFLIWYKHLEVPFCLFWFWTYQNRITRHGFMQLENWDFGNKFRWYLGKNVEFFMKKIVWKYPFVLFIVSRITSLLKSELKMSELLQKKWATFTHVHELKLGGKYEPIMSHVREWMRRSRSHLYISVDYDTVWKYSS